MCESLSLGSILIDGGFADTVLCASCSHFATAERQYRNPLELGSQRPPAAQWTVTGAGSTLLGACLLYTSFAKAGNIVDGRHALLWFHIGSNLSFRVFASYHYSTHPRPGAIRVPGALYFYGKTVFCIQAPKLHFCHAQAPA